MKLNLSDFRIVKKLPSVLYCVQYYRTPTDKDIKALKNSIYYQYKKDHFFSWFIGVSVTDGDTASKSFEKTGKRGRPKVKVDGLTVDRHVHIGIIGTSEKSGYSVALKISRSINKRFGKKITKVVSMEGSGFIGYVYQQSYSFEQGGDINFLQYKDKFYLEGGRNEAEIAD